MNLSKPIEWQPIKVGFLGFQGDQLLCIVEKLEDLPVEGWVPNILQDTFMTPEGAMACAAKILARIEKHDREHDEPTPAPMTKMAIPVLRGVLEYLEGSQPQIVEHTPAEAKPEAG